MNADPNQPLITPEMIEALKSRDERWKTIDLATRIEAELRDSVALKLLMDNAEFLADEALKELATVNPTDTKKITELQATWFRSDFIKKTLQMCLTKADDAMESLQQDGPVSFEDKIDANPPG